MEGQIESKDQVVSLAKMYRRIFPTVASLVKKYGGGEEDAKDIFHDALLIWLEKPEQERAAVDNQNAYVITIARNEWFRRIEKADKVKNIELFSDETSSKVSDELYNYLVNTGKRCLELLQAFYYEKCSAAEIANRFGFSGAHSASAQKYKCLGKLRQLVKTNNRNKEDFYEN